jgi:hypothetical protein
VQKLRVKSSDLHEENSNLKKALEDMRNFFNSITEKDPDL